MPPKKRAAIAAVANARPGRDFAWRGVYDGIPQLPAELADIVTRLQFEVVRTQTTQAYRDLHRLPNGDYEGVVYASDEPNAFRVIGRFDRELHMISGIEYRPAGMPVYKFVRSKCYFRRRAGARPYSQPYLIRVVDGRREISIDVVDRSPANIQRVLAGEPYRATMTPLGVGANFDSYIGDMVLTMIEGHGVLKRGATTERGTFVDGKLHGFDCARIRRKSARVGEFRDGLLVHGTIHLPGNRPNIFLHGDLREFDMDERDPEEDTFIDVVVGYAGSRHAGDIRLGAFSIETKLPVGNASYEAREFDPASGWKRLKGAMQLFMVGRRQLPTMSVRGWSMGPPARKPAHLFAGHEYYETKSEVMVRSVEVTRARTERDIPVTSFKEIVAPASEKYRLAKIGDMLMMQFPTACPQCLIAFETMRAATLAFGAQPSVHPTV